MAPEQADLKGIPDARWDVYGLGALLYHMVTGAPPFRTPEADAKLQATDSLEDQLAVYRRIVTLSPRPALHRRAPGIDAPLIDIIDRCLAVSSSRRLPNAQAVLDRLADRERQRSRRPLLLLGLVMPLLLALFIAPLASEAMYVAVSTAQTILARRALEGDALSVNLLSSSLQRELVDRREALKDVADDPDFREVVAKHIGLATEQRTGLDEFLIAEFDRVQQRRKELGRLPDASWFLMDSGGYQRWHRDPEHPKESVDEFFGYRDYFHGMTETFTVENAPPNLPPIQQPYVSRVYFSSSSKRFRVAISVPVRNPDSDKVIGVLARSIYVSDLLTDYERSVTMQQADSVGRVLALIDSRDWKLIAHSEWQRHPKIAPDKPNEFEQLKLSPAMIDRLKTLMQQSDGTPIGELDRVDDYGDPMQALDPEHFSGRWLAAFSPVGKTGWIAVVQERRAAAFEPVDELRTKLVLFGLTAVAIVVVLVAGCWWLIVRIVNNRPLKFWRPATSPGNFPTAGMLTESAKGNDRG
jgi:serine/threonine protein kinase